MKVMYQQNYDSMQTWIILEQKDNDNSEMISANCAVGHSLKKGRVHMLFICQRGLQGFQVVKRSPYILLPFEQLKNSIQRGGLKKCFPKFDWLLLPLDNKVIVSVTITDFVFDFGNNRFIKKLKSPFCSILFCKTLCTNAMNTSNGWSPWLSLLLIKKCKHEKFRQIIFRQMFYRVLRKIFGTDGDRVTTNRQRETCIFRHYAIYVSHIQRNAA